MTPAGLKIVITANGEGSRMKGISPAPKHLLYYGGKRAYEHIRDALDAYGPVYILTSFEFEYQGVEWIKCQPASTRRETLENLRGWENVLIVDCDIIPFGADDIRWAIKLQSDFIWYFHSDSPKYGGLAMDESGRLTFAAERDPDACMRASGLYLLKNMDLTLEKMKADPNGLAAAMIGAKMISERTFVRFGDIEDYQNAVKNYRND